MRRDADFRMKILLVALVVTALIIVVYPGKTTFSGSHTIYKEDSGAYGAAEMCVKCHRDIFSRLSTSAAHNAAVTGCICHGYNPNASGGIYDVNVRHNLTKNIYCTNCHANDASGSEVWTENQSAHYIYFNRSETDELYNRSKAYFREL